MRSRQLPVPGGAVESGATPKQDNRAPGLPSLSSRYENDPPTPDNLVPVLP